MCIKHTIYRSYQDKNPFELTLNEPKLTESLYINLLSDTLHHVHKPIN